MYRILENAKTCLYGNKADDVFETNPITVLFCYCPEMKISGTLNKHPGFRQRCKMIQQVAMKKCSGIAWSSRPQVFSKKGVLENFAKSTGKHLYQRPFLNKYASLTISTYLKKGSGLTVFLWNLQNFQKHLFLLNTSGRLLLNSLIRRFTKVKGSLFCLVI